MGREVEIDFTPDPHHKMCPSPYILLPSSPSLSLTPFLPLRAASPLIQRNSRRLSTPLYHCFTWEETRIRGIKEGVYREIRNVLFLVHPSFPPPPSCPYNHISPPLVELANRGDPPISNFESMYLTKLFFFSFFFVRAELVEVLFCSISMSKERFDHSTVSQPF